MCSKQTPYFTKWIIGFVMMMIGIIVIRSVYFSSGGDSEATIEMQGDDNKSVVQQSAGLHFHEVNNSGDCQGKWSWAEYTVVIMGFLFILKCSHFLHYCFVTKAIVRKKVAQVEMEMKDLG
jgi:hypothetical protein